MLVARKEALWCCISPMKILLESLRVIHYNKLVFFFILCFTILPLSFLVFTLTISTHTLRSQIYHLEVVARLASTLMEARHVWEESRDDAISLIHARLFFSLLCFPLSLAAAISAVNSTFSAVQGKSVTVKSVVSTVKDNWKRPSVTAILVYVILLAFSPVPRVIASFFELPVSRFVVRVIGSGLEVYLMAVMSLGLVVSITEERLGLEAIRVGSDLMEGRRFCGWFLSGMFVLVSGFISRRVEVLMDGSDSISVWDKTVLICSYGLVVLLSYVINTVFYCDSRKQHAIKEPEEQEDSRDCDLVGSSL